MSVQILTLIVSVSVGVAILWANPRRVMNQAFTAASMLVALWLYILWILSRPDLSHPVPWLKAISAVGSLFPWVLWWIGQCAVRPDCRWRDFFVFGKYWMLFTLLMVSLAFSDWFIPTQSTPTHPMRGPGYSIYIVCLILAYLILVAQAILQMRRLTGIHLIEVKTLLVGGAISCMAGLGITAVPPLLGMPSLAAYAPLVVLLFYTRTAWGITSHRIFDARQLFLILLKRAIILVAASGLLALWLTHAGPLFPPGVAMLLGLSGCVTAIMYLERKFSGASLLGKTNREEEVRAAILSASREEVDPEALLVRYCTILSSWSRSRQTCVRVAGATGQSGNPWILAADSPGLLLLQEERWATPESLARRRLTPAVDELDRFMAAQKLGVLVLSPRALGTTPIAVGLGQRDDGMPFLWPEIRTLMQWAELMEVAISRVQLTKRARETEQVATAGLLGASLAHEIRNPLVALKTFAQLLPERHNDPEFRDEFSKLLQKEVGRIEGLTEQLLKLSTPHKPVLRPVRLSEIITDCTNLLKAKFADSHTSLSLDLTPHERPIMADGGSVSQVVLNLLVNAQQALASQAGERLIRVRTEQLPDQLALEIADNGPGINAKQRERLFQPFSSGKINGFGLGLALSANIMRVHQGSIKLVETGHPGATFRLIFPCPPSSS